MVEHNEGKSKSLPLRLCIIQAWIWIRPHRGRLLDAFSQLSTTQTQHSCTMGLSFSQLAVPFAREAKYLLSFGSSTLCTGQRRGRAGRKSSQWLSEVDFKKPKVLTTSVCLVTDGESSHLPRWVPNVLSQRIFVTR